MTPETAKKWLPLITALANGKKIQWANHFKSETIWIDVSYINPKNSVDDYRVKPEPVVLERWVNVYSDGTTGYLHKTQEDCIKASIVKPIACVKVIIKYEEGEKL